MERTLLILKPDALQRRLIGKIIGRFEDKGFQIMAMKMTRLHEAVVRKHYGAHQGKPFYEPLVRYMSGCPLVLMIVQAKNAVAIARKLMGHTFGSNAHPGTIRGDLALSNRFNLIHGSDSTDAAEKEISLYFTPDEICAYDDLQENALYDLSTGERI